LFLTLLSLSLPSLNLKANNSTGQCKKAFESLNSSNVINYTIDDGLVSNHIYAISQDSLGYIWIATRAGISRFNGNEFYNFTTKNGLVKNETFGLHQAENKRIWIGSNGPISYIENGDINFLDVDIKQKLNWNYSVFEKDNSLWVTFESFLYLINLNSNETTLLSESNLLEKGGSVILDWYNKHLFVYNNNTIFWLQNDSIVGKLPVSYKKSDSFGFVKANYNNGIFFINEQQLFYFNFATKKIKEYNVNVNDVLRIKIFEDELILIYANGGLRTAKIKENLSIEFAVKTNADVIYTEVFRDKDLNFWLGTNTQGLLFLPKKSNQITSKKNVSDVSLKALNRICVDGDSIWLGTKSAQLFLIYDDKAKAIDLSYKNPNGETRINDIVKLKSGRILISTDAGLFMMDGDELKHFFYTALKKISYVGDDIYLNCYNSIYKTNEECLFVLLNKFSTQERRNIELLKSVDFLCIESIHNSRSHQTLFLNETEVLVYEPDKGLLNYKIEDGKLSYGEFIKENIDVYDLVHYKNWVFIATIGEGILSYNLQTKKITPLSNIKSSAIYSLDVDTISNKLYAGTNQGVYIINLDKYGLEDYSINITKNQGLSGSEIQQVVCANSKIYAISEIGIDFIDNDFIMDERLPNFKVEQFIANETHFPAYYYNELKDSVNDITIHFNKIDFTKTINSQVAYKKDNDKWEKTQNTSLNFDDMAHGKHTIKLGLVSGNEEIPSKIEKINFHIKPKFHQTIWAKLIAGLAALVMIFLVFSYFFSQQNLKVLENLVTKRTQQLNFKMQELDEVNSQLKIKNKNLSSYTYLVSHDLKAPLYNISSFLKIISEKNKEKFDNTDKEYFKNINYGLKSMINKINDLLKYSKVTSDIDLEKIEPLNLNKIITEVKKDFKYEIDKKSIQFLVDTDLPKVKLEKTSAHLLFQNLISNAVKYNRSNQPFIKINSHQNAKHITIAVKDNGIGIKESYQPEAFDIFSRGHNNQSYEGTGIGLAICKKIVEAHNGKIELDSSENIGTVLSLTFPKVS